MPKDERKVGLKQRLARALDGLGVVNGLLRLRRVVPMPWLTCFCYHRTAEVTVAAGDSAIVDATPAQFDDQLSVLCDHFTFVGLDDVAAHLSHGARLPKNPALITFDDGYKECFTVALPVLVRRGAKASFFIPTRFLDDRRMFWWDQVSLMLERTREETIELEYPKPVRLRVAEARGPLLDIIKKTPKLDVNRFLEEVERAAGVTIGLAEERQIADRTLMTWDQVSRLTAAGMDVGSHTRTHRVLGTLDPSEYDAELRGSRLDLEDRVGRPVRTIAYPVGYTLGRARGLRDAVRAAGYTVGFSCRASAMTTAFSADPLDVPRLLMDAAYGRQDFTVIASLPALAPRTSVDLA